MLTRLLRAALPLVLAGAFGAPPAHADIYTWVDASGTINISNLAPPDGATVTKVTHESAPPAAARDEAARESARRAEVQGLAERVRQLEDEVDFAARRQMPPPPEYRPIPPPVVQYFIEAPPPPVQYTVNVAPLTNSGCDPTWMDCGFSWFSGFYPTNVVFIRTPGFTRSRPGHGGHHLAAQQPMRSPGRKG